MATALDMRSWIDLMDNPIPFTKQSLFESVSSIAMKDYLSELYECSVNDIIPSFNKLWESLSKINLVEAEDPDEVLRLALKKYGSIEAVLDALKNTPKKQPSIDSVSEETKQSVTVSAKKWYNLAIKKTPPVKDADEWIPKKLDELENLIDGADKAKKFTGLKTVLRKIADYQKKHPVLTTFVVALFGVAAAILRNTAAWPLGAVVLLCSLALSIMNGEGFHKAWKRILAVLVGVLIGIGINIAITKLNNQVDSLPQQYTAPSTVAPDVINVPTPPANEALIHKEDSEWIKRLRELMDPSGEGVGVPTIDAASFEEAFKKARGSMGVGHAFVWKGNAFTTNIQKEGLLAGFPSAAVNFIKGTK